MSKSEESEKDAEREGKEEIGEMRRGQIPERETTEVREDERQDEMEVKVEVTRESMPFDWAVEDPRI